MRVDLTKEGLAGLFKLVESLVLLLQYIFYIQSRFNALNDQHSHFSRTVEFNPTWFRNLVSNGASVYQLIVVEIQELRKWGQL
ncbi:unnamed protein product [Allacma fusca]|uniref:Uncharacterized protein n=1 Tax=Allacma fusca TaxID=39272 RepID=A0A8J2JVV0_9HEXA|nr:unnamed protein product [Allacma fusca]